MRIQRVIPTDDGTLTGISVQVGVLYDPLRAIDTMLQLQKLQAKGKYGCTEFRISPWERIVRRNVPVHLSKVPVVPKVWVSHHSIVF